MCLAEMPIYRARDPLYEMDLYVYPVSMCGEDLQRGSPVKVSARGTDLCALKCRIPELILSVVPHDDKCFVEMRLTKDGEYCDCDEWWCSVDFVNKKVDSGYHV